MNNNAPQNQLPPQANGGQNAAANAHGQNGDTKTAPAGWPPANPGKPDPDDFIQRGL